MSTSVHFITKLFIFIEVVACLAAQISEFVVLLETTGGGDEPKTSVCHS
jgi:hypothetical protein